ncbi:hypothetical protein AOZ07_08510 [Glutamicibacter halophytocola]|uniref:Winged helix-turn-helix transcriptional regulator n=2 Tax=Glutamicibacter halophytocola TaxID=1933880 RepID=A0ABX5Y5Y6_9MICC|nr:hypothetical protein AOZ07_08510 [Glutamicibacter halophytocola]QDY65271.1 winged helix-turn-helix transcriptional regulator [Glutamicibacter halophytocola]
MPWFQGVFVMTGEYSVPRARAEIISSDLLDMTVTVLKTLSDPLRLQMLWALCDRDLTLSELAQLIGVSPTVAGQLLSRMRTAGVLQTEKSGRHVIYSMHDELSRQFIRQTLDFAAHRLELQGASDSTED